MRQPGITISIVTFNTDPAVLSNCLDSVAQITIPFVCFVVDNSRNTQIRAQVERAATRLSATGRLFYLSNENVGYGAAHNTAIRKAMDEYNSPFHLVINPDITFSRGTVESLVEQMHREKDIGLLSPRILFPDGRLQRLCKLLPSPGHLFIRRFMPFAAGRGDRFYQLEFADYDTSFDCPCLSGCFMQLRTAALRKVGLFDERFFLYCEDVDLVRRIGQYYRTVYWPKAAVVHHYEKGSYSSAGLLLHHVVSAVRYFNKWGWVFDRQRRKINRETLNRVSEKNVNGG